MTNEIPFIVADIGGTNARFGLVYQDHSSPVHIGNIQKYPSSQFDNIEQAVFHYMETLSLDKIAGACLAVAGPVDTDEILLTNLNWRFSEKQLKQKLQLAKLTIINDFVAYALATQHVDKKELIRINPGKALQSAPITVIGPGTGFGVASLIPMPQKFGSWQVVASEGGHMTLSARSKLQLDILQLIAKKHPLVTIERLLSGPGLVNLYEAFAVIQGVKPDPLSASDISAIAQQDKTSLAYQSFSLFCYWLGQAASDIAICLGARGGIYLCGGILKKNLNLFLESDFLKGFTENPIMRNYLKNIPIHLVSANNTALIGAAVAFENE